MDQAPQTVMDVLDARARTLADRVAFTLLRQGEVESGRLTFGELHHRAVAMAAQLTALSARGDRALLLYAQGLEFIVAFLACLYAGVIAVPVSAPNRRRGLQALAGIAADSGAKWLFSTGALLDQLSEDIAEEASFPALRCLDPERLADVIAEGWSPPAVAPQSVALLQYTSGSTGSPRGVAVTHANLVDNHEQMRLSFGHDETTVVVSWLPMFHDMGLGTIVMTVWAGAHCVLMSPSAFVQHPRRWLAAISRYRATTSLAPDFAYDLCTRRIGPHEREGLDLSSWRAAVNGSEPVRASTLQRFTETFGPWGFRWKAFQAGYGLAEATLFVSSAHPSEPPVVREFSSEALAKGAVEPPQKFARGQALVSCGRPWGATQLAIVNPETGEECPSNRVGEIWVGGGSVAAGYWGRGAANDAIFAAMTSAGRGPFLRTGDLGFVDEGHLFVTGRHKDLVIIRGRNHYPQDIEQSVSTSHPALVPHGCAAFSIDSAQGEQLVIVQEVVRTALRTLDSAAVVRAIRAVISEQHALHTHAVVLLKPSTLPRTTSGKVRRKLCRQAFLDNTLPAMACWVAPMSPIPDTDTHPDSAQREASSRADRLIEWLRRHAADLINSYATEERRTVPPALLRHLAKQGLLGMQVAPQYGGLGLGHSDIARVIEQLAAFDFGLALFVGLNNYLGIQPIAKYGGQQLKGLLLPGLVHGEEVAAFAFAEPGAGAGPNVLTVEAKVDGEDRWRLFGTKYLDGVVQGASVMNVFAQHEEPPGISSFVVLEGVEGLHPVREGLSMGLLGFTRETIALDGAGVGRENLLGSLGSGLDIAREAMMHTRLAIGAACIGGMKRCAQLVSRDGPYAGPIQGKLTPNPVILSRLGSVTARVTALECLVQRLTRAIDAGHTPPSEAFAACKIIGPEMLLRSVDDLMQLGVQASYADTNRLSSLYRDAGLLRNFDGLPEAVAERMGAELLAGDASLRLLIGEVLGAPEVVQWISPVMEVVRHRMTNLTGALARRPERWANTRAGELATWLVLVAAVDASRRAGSTAELERAYAWAKAQFEQALASVRFGTPSETATLDKSDLAATFASYARTIGDFEPPPAMRDVSSSTRGQREPAAANATIGQERPAPYASEVSRRELRAWLVSWLARRLQIPVAEVDAARSFADHGLDSVAAVELATALSDKLGRELDATVLWNFATIDALVEYVVSSTTALQPASSDVRASEPASPSPAGRAETLEDELARLERELSSRS